MIFNRHVYIQAACPTWSQNYVLWGLTGFEVGLEIVPLVVSPLRSRGGAIQNWAQLLMAPEAGGGVGGWCGWVGGQAGVCDEGRRSARSASRFLRWGVRDGCVELCKSSSTKSARLESKPPGQKVSTPIASFSKCQLFPSFI
jgi:hypothetical protein